MTRAVSIVEKEKLFAYDENGNHIWNPLNYSIGYTLYEISKVKKGHMPQAWNYLLR